MRCCTFCVWDRIAQFCALVSTWLPLPARAILIFLWVGVLRLIRDFLWGILFAAPGGIRNTHCGFDREAKCIDPRMPNIQLRNIVVAVKNDQTSIIEKHCDGRFGKHLKPCFLEVAARNRGDADQALSERGGTRTPNWRAICVIKEVWWRISFSIITAL